MKKPKPYRKKEDNLAFVEIGDLLPAGMTFVVLVVALGCGAVILGDIQNTNPTCPTYATSYNSTGHSCFNATNSGYHPLNADFNISESGMGALTTIASKLGILATIIVLGAVLTVIMRLIQVRFGGE